MSKHSNIAASVVELVGGKQNISNIFHCMTRLRFNVKDMGKVDIEGIKKVEGVLGVNEASGEIQVIIGAGVETVYNEAVKLAGVEEHAAINENLDPSLAKKNTGIKGVLNGIMNALSGAFSPLVPLFVVVGVFNMIAVLIGPQFFNLVAEDSALYQNFYFTGQAILYFLPVLVGYTAARHFGATPLITMAIAGIMLYPGFVSLIEGGAAYSVYGIPVPAVTYGASVIPIILIAFVQKYVEKLLNRITPDIIKVIIIPCVTVLIMLPIAFCALGPLGNYVGTWIGQLLYWLYDFAGPIATMLFGAFAAIGTATGILRPIFLIAMTTLFATGAEFVVMPISMVVMNWVVMGCAVGYAIRAKGAKKKQFALTCFGSNLLGGVSEPTMFGIVMNHPRIIMATVIAGAVSGLYVGLFKVGYYAFGPSNFLGVIGFFGGEPSNFVHGCIASGIAFVCGILATLALYKEDSVK